MATRDGAPVRAGERRQARGAAIAEATARTHGGAGRISFDAHWRKDIGQRAIGRR